MKRALPAFSATKRARHDETIVGRLCDLDNASVLFFDEHNSSLAKERGILRSRVATDKYRDLERQLLEAIQDADGVAAFTEAELRDLLPKELEAETADALVNQYVRHQRYEAAARQLACEAVADLREAHEREIQKLKLEHEASITRVKVSADVRSTADVEEITDQLQQAREEYEEKVSELEEKAEKLAELLEEAGAKQEQTEKEARAELEEMAEAMEEMKQHVAAAQEETDLKREASRRLKEEVIDNDRLTVANLNRIKNLEGQLMEQRQTIEELEGQNAELRAREGDEDEVEALKELLQERERQLMQLSHKLEVREAMAEMQNNPGRLEVREGGKRESLLERVGKASFGSLI